MKSQLTVMLVEPEYGINIGYVARTMANFGIKDLIITGRKKIPEIAYRFASHAGDILKNAKMMEFDEALKKYDYRIATSARASKDWRTVIRRARYPEESFKNALKHRKVLLILGRDTTGLTNEEIMKCDDLIKIPTSEEYPALNISHSLAILLYIWSIMNRKTKIKKVNVPREEVDALINYIGSIAKAVDLEEERAYRVVKLYREIALNKLDDDRDMLTLLGFFRDILNALNLNINDQTNVGFTT
ncbi:MAG: TrmH family RNA methyltransferase [Nitrososphaeria archaeon]